MLHYMIVSWLDIKQFISADRLFCSLYVLSTRQLLLAMIQSGILDRVKSKPAVINMLKLMHMVFLSALLMTSAAVAAQQATTAAVTPETDNRILVEMPTAVQAMMRKDMRAHLVSMGRMIAAIADQRLQDAADVASQELGSASMGQHRAAGGGPGRYMPTGMRSIGMSMHAAADALAAAAEAGDQTQVMQQLSQISAACSACHSSYRIR